MGWSEIKNRDGVRLYERPVQKGNLMEYLGVTSLEAKMEVIGEVFRDVSQYVKWVADCARARIVKKYDRNTFVIHMILKPPLISDRDVVLKNETRYDYNNGCATITVFPTKEVKIPPEDDCTRITLMRGIFELDFLGRDRTKVIYKLKVDPAGYVPKVVAYSVIRNYPFHTLKKLKEVVKNSQYAAAARGTEEERQINARTFNVADVRKILLNKMVPLVKHPRVLRDLLDADTKSITALASAGSPFSLVEKTVVAICHQYLEKIVADKNRVEQLIGGKRLDLEMIDGFSMGCEANLRTLDEIMIDD